MRLPLIILPWLFVGVILSLGCSILPGGSSRVLEGRELTVSVILPNHIQKISQDFPFYLFRLVPVEEANRAHHKIASIGLERQYTHTAVIEKEPIALGDYKDGNVSFTLPRSLVPSTHCFLVVFRKSMGVPTSRFGPDNERYFIGLSAYQGGAAQDSTVPRATGSDFSCAGRIEDFWGNETKLEF